ncbi:MAG: FecR family protein [Gammaproteobacteria bacterium]|nr:FecR family protein [Gammaproteobacteria bacterium]
MNKSSEGFSMRGDKAIEELLEHAAPRSTPPTEHESMVRDAVYAEWRAVTGRVRMRQRMTFFAVAATVLLGIAVSFNALQVTDVQSVQVATISKSHGSIYLLGDQSVLNQVTDLESISAGEVIVTGEDSGIGLEWGNGGSLRIDKNTRIRFTSEDSVYLESGRIYFDSRPSQLVAAITGSGLEITTDHGSVRHLGTQFMTYADTERLSVSVREGEVAVDGVYVEEAVAVKGQRLTVSGGARPVVVNINGYGEAWDWIENTAPSADVDGKSVDEFLKWVGRETGLQVSYESSAAEQKARDGILKGSIDMSPRDELRFRMSGEDLDYRIDGGTIYVSAIDSSSRP